MNSQLNNMPAQVSNPVDSAHSSESNQHHTIDFVGMSGIALPIRVADSTLGDVYCEAKVQTFVNLADPKAKGIHMSRLYLLLQKHGAVFALSPSELTTLLQEQIASQKSLSDTAYLGFEFDLHAERSALKSDNKGWKSYPVSITAQQKAHTLLDVVIKVPYSSTCPCSAALSRQRLVEAFLIDFSDSQALDKNAIDAWLRSDKGSVATPHSQRSWATVKLRLSPEQISAFPLIEVIDAVEDSLATPVQTAVKREDEQAFAELNGSNLMFCEDAVRRITATLEPMAYVQDYWIKVEHLESLHAHDAVAINTKGIVDGFAP